MDRTSLLPLASTGNDCSTGRKRIRQLRILSIITLGVVFVFTLYRREFQRDTYHVVGVSFTEHIQHLTIPINHLPVSTDIDPQSDSTRRPTGQATTTAEVKSTPTTVTNNHATYPKLAPLPSHELSAMREKHLNTIDEAIANGLPYYHGWNVKQLTALKEYWPKVVDEQPKVRPLLHVALNSASNQ